MKQLRQYVRKLLKENYKIQDNTILALKRYIKNQVIVNYNKTTNTQGWLPKVGFTNTTSDREKFYGIFEQQLLSKKSHQFVLDVLLENKQFRELSFAVFLQGDLISQNRIEKTISKNDLEREQRAINRLVKKMGFQNYIQATVGNNFTELTMLLEEEAYRTINDIYDTVINSSPEWTTDLDGTYVLEREGAFITTRSDSEWKNWDLRERSSNILFDWKMLAKKR